MDVFSLLPLIFVSSLIDSINPCAISVLLITIAFLYSMNSSRERVIAIGASYIFGIFLVYILIGLGTLSVLDFFGTPKIVSKITAITLIAAGAINLINEYFPRFPIKLKIPSFTHGLTASLINRGTIPAAFLTGFLVGLFEFPCTGGPYLLVLGLLHDSETRLTGLVYLVFYNLVFVLPLVVILALATSKKALAKIEDLKKTKFAKSRFIGGFLMILLGLLILATSIF